MTMRSRIALPIAASLLAACGGGGGGITPAQPTPTPGATNSGPAVTFSIAVPAASSPAARKAAYVSPNTGSVQIALQTVNGATPKTPFSQTFAVSSTAQGCSAASSGGFTCTISVPAPPGVDVFTISTYQSPNGSGTALATTSVSVSAASGSAANVPLSLGGVPAQLSFSPAKLPMASDGAIHRYPVTMNIADASGATIVGAAAYQSPVSLQVINDPAHALTLSTTLVTQPGTVVTVTYDSSKQLAQAQIVAADNGMQSATLNAAPLNVNPSSVLLYDTAASSPVTLSEAGFTGSYAVNVANASDASVSVNAGPLNSGSAVASIIPKVRFDVTSLQIGDGNLTENIPLTIAPQAGTYSTYGTAHAIQPAFSFIKSTDGTFWTTDGNTGSIVQFNPANGTFTPHVVDSTLAGPSSIALDGSGNVWYTDGTQIGEWVAASSTVRTFSSGFLSSPTRLTSIIAGPSGTMWFYDMGQNNAISSGHPTWFGSINTSTGFIQEYPTGNDALSIPMGMMLAPDNSIWFGDAYNSALGHINTSSGAITETPIGTPNAPQQAPMQFAATPDGKIWMACYGSSSGTSTLASIDPNNNDAITYYTQGLPSGGFMYAMTLASDGNVWFAEDPASGSFRSNQMLIGVLNPQTGAIYEYPTAVPNDAQITGLIDGGSGSLWMLDSAFGRIGKVTFK
ncbi:MAG: hypothetical protein JO322_05430 [Candidatus Eremiobacteraeota bacterium]|nr:hypothetical protein [Candidatus Eremiobacteraeota bacterium]